MKRDSQRTSETAAKQPQAPVPTPHVEQATTAQPAQRQEAIPAIKQEAKDAPAQTPQPTPAKPAEAAQTSLPRASDEPLAQAAAAQERGAATMRKGIVIHVKLYLEAYDAPADDFAKKAVARVRELLKPMLADASSGWKQQIRKIEAQDDTDDE